MGLIGRPWIKPVSVVGQQIRGIVDELVQIPRAEFDRTHWNLLYHCITIENKNIEMCTKTCRNMSNRL